MKHEKVYLLYDNTLLGDLLVGVYDSTKAALAAVDKRNFKFPREVRRIKGGLEIRGTQILFQYTVEAHKIQH